MSRETDELLQPVGSGVVFGLLPEAADSREPLAVGSVSRLSATGLRLPSRRQAVILAATAALAAGGAAAVVWVARRRG